MDWRNPLAIMALSPELAWIHQLCHAQTKYPIRFQHPYGSSNFFSFSTSPIQFCRLAVTDSVSFSLSAWTIVCAY